MIHIAECSSLHQMCKFPFTDDKGGRVNLAEIVKTELLRNYIILCGSRKFDLKAVYVRQGRWGEEEAQCQRTWRMKN